MRFIVVALLVAGSLTVAAQSEKKSITPRMTSASAGVSGSLIEPTTDKDGSTGSVTYTVTNLTGSAFLANNLLTLGDIGSILVQATVAPDADHKEGMVSQLITINATIPDGPRVYGTMRSGGSGKNGVIYSINPDGTDYRVLKEFLTSPTGNNVSEAPNHIVSVGNGKYYGTTTEGGSLNNGVIFEYDLTTDHYSIIHEFSDLSNRCQLTVGSDGFIYGATGESATTNLVIIKIDPVTHEIARLLSTSTIQQDVVGTALTEFSVGIFYGYARFPGSKGGVFEYNSITNTATIRFQQSYNSLGQANLDLRLKKAPNDKLYMALQGFYPNGYLIFEFDPSSNSGNVKVYLPNGQNVWGLTLNSEGNFTGIMTAPDTYVFEYVPGETLVTTSLESPEIKDLWLTPFIMAGNNKLYSITDASSIVEYDPHANELKTVYEFDTPLSSGLNQPLTIAPDGTIVGMCDFDRQAKAGAIFTFDPGTRTYSERFNFMNPPDGMRPDGFDLQIDNKLYGVIYGSEGAAIFEFDAATMKYRRFITNESIIASSLYLSPDNKIYALSINDRLVRFDPVSREYMTISDPIPMSDQGVHVTVTKNGKVFAITYPTYDQLGNAHGSIIYEVNTQTGEVIGKTEGTETDYYEAGQFGEGPDSKLYMFGSSGANGYGFIGRYDPVNNVFESVYDFNETDGANPATGNIPYFSSAGKLYGITSGGADNGLGAIFEYDVTNDQLVNKYPFTSGHSALALGKPFVEVNGNKLFGSIYSRLAGSLFVFDPASGAFTSSNATTATGVGPSGSLIFADIKQVIPKLDQTITFEDLPNKTLGDVSFNLTASSSSGLPVTFTASSDKISIAGSTVTLIKSGKATVTASQAGNLNYNPAPSQGQSFCINPAKPTITASGEILTSSNESGNQWYFNGADIPGAVNKTYTATTSGLYTVKTVIESCPSEMSGTSNVTITGLEDSELQSVVVYPNPADKHLIIELPESNPSGYQITINDVLGRAVDQRQSTSGASERFDVSMQPKGFYFIRIASNGKSIVKKVVIR